MGNCISSAVGGLGVVLHIHGADTMELILFTFMIISIISKQEFTLLELRT